jgi:RimJ/RimL family protein N-acetyltransferase
MTLATTAALRMIDTPELVECVAQWLAAKENAQWLDFGDGQKTVTAVWVRALAKSPRHALRVFTTENAEPIGVAALGTIDHVFKTANLWFVLGDKRYARCGYTTRGAAEMLRVGFREMQLHAINTWTVDGNPSANIVRRLQFKPAGRQRECHRIDGVPRDRLLFDLLASEYSEDSL